MLRRVLLLLAEFCHVVLSMFPVFLPFFFKYLPFTEESKGRSDLFGGVLKGTYHDEAAVIESQLELEVSLFVLLENTVEFSCIIPAGIFGNH